MQNPPFRRTGLLHVDCGSGRQTCGAKTVGHGRSGKVSFIYCRDTKICTKMQSEVVKRASEGRRECLRTKKHFKDTHVPATLRLRK